MALLSALLLTALSPAFTSSENAPAPSLLITPSSQQVVWDVRAGDLRIDVTPTQNPATIYTEWAAGPRHYDDVKVRFLMNEKGSALTRFIGGVLDEKQPLFSFDILKPSSNSSATRIICRDWDLDSFTVPQLDATSDDPVYFSAALTRGQVAGLSSEPINPADFAVKKQKLWSPANFRLTIDGLDCTKVNKIESFTIKQKVVQDDVGIMRRTLECGDFAFFLSADNCKALNDEMANYNGKFNFRNGQLDFLDDLGNVTGSLLLQNMVLVSTGIVGQRHLGFVSTAHGEAAEEEIIFRANHAKLVAG